MSSKEQEYVDEEDYLSGEIDGEGESLEGQESEPEIESEGEQCFESLDDVFANQPKSLPPFQSTQQDVKIEPEIEEYEEAEGESQDSDESEHEEEELKINEIIGDKEIYSADKKSKITYCDYEGDKQLTSNVKSSITTTFNKEDQNRMRVKDKNDRATVDQVLDPRTLSVLYKWLKNGTLTEIFGSVSTGKEANVYYAYRNPTQKVEDESHETISESNTLDPSMSKKDIKRYRKAMRQKHDEKVARAALNFDTEKDFALKIYKTTVLVFRDRERYVEGEYRFRKTKYKNNPMKMVKQWAEKEMRNLKRLKSIGLNVPEAYLLKNNIIIMEFIGNKGLAAPRLKDADLSEPQMIKAYFDVLKIMRKMYQECKMVHGDLSEYNLLYFNDLVYVIDVSQSVEQDHPMSLDFLRRDCVNVNDYIYLRFLSLKKFKEIGM